MSERQHKCAGQTDNPPILCRRCGATENNVCSKGNGVPFDLRRLTYPGASPIPSPKAVRALAEAARALIETSYQDPRGFFVVGEDEICALNATLTPFPAPEAKEAKP